MQFLVSINVQTIQGLQKNVPHSLLDFSGCKMLEGQFIFDMKSGIHSSVLKSGYLKNEDDLKMKTTSQGCARPVFECWDWDWDSVYPVSIFYTETFKIGIKFWYWDWDFKSLGLSIKNWDWVHWVSVSVSTCKNWSRTSLFCIMSNMGRHGAGAWPELGNTTSRQLCCDLIVMNIVLEVLHGCLK